MLKPCPFYGETPIYDMSDWGVYKIICKACGGMMVSHKESEKEYDFIKRWNRRVESE